MPEHHAAKSLGQLPIQRHIEMMASSGEIFVELVRDGVETRRRLQHPRTDPVGQVLQDSVIPPLLNATRTSPTAVAAISREPTGESTVR